MACFKLTIAYDGTAFVGWQRQASGLSIQGLLEEAVEPLAGRAVTVIGAGRTDAGVHALGQVASVSLDVPLDARTLLRATNARLPLAIRVLSCEQMHDQFHARFDACSKRYRYRVTNARVQLPFDRSYAWHIPTPVLDLAAMNAAAVLLEGEHDFASFQTTGGEVMTTVRQIYTSRVVLEPPGRDRQSPDGPERPPDGDQDQCFCYEVWGSGFLRHMVRAIVGSLVEVGRGAQSPDWFATLLRGGDRALAGRTAPPTGLFLTRVHYHQPDLAAQP